MRIYIDCRQAAHIACGPQKVDLQSPTLIGADLCGYASAHHFEGYISEISLWQRSLDAAAASCAHHVSVYDLQIEPRTAFGR